MNVEMDPTSECEVRQAITDSNMSVVGWYHSHPTFRPDPSIVDLQNQRNYQQLFRDELMNEEPFVGVIIGVLNYSLGSTLNMFCIFFKATVNCAMIVHN
jgi:hypothetical protein